MSVIRNLGEGDATPTAQTHRDRQGQGETEDKETTESGGTPSAVTLHGYSMFKMTVM